MAIHQQITIKSAPGKVYAALTDAAEFSAFTGAPAEIDEDGEFSCFGGQVTGRNVALEADRKIVQEWRVGAWPADVFSTVSFTLDEDGAGTRITLDHSGYPEEMAEHLDAGWHKMYWQPLKAYCERG